MRYKKPKPLSSYQKLKKKIEEMEKEYVNLKNDFKKYSKGDFGVKTHYDTMFKFEEDLEKTMWAGESSFKDNE